MTNQDKALSSDTVTLPKIPTEAMLRPFYECPPDELEIAYSAMIFIAEAESRRAASPQLPVAQMSGDPSDAIERIQDVCEFIEDLPESEEKAASLKRLQSALRIVQVASQPSNADHIPDAGKKVAATVPTVVQAPIELPELPRLIPTDYLGIQQAMMDYARKAIASLDSPIAATVPQVVQAPSDSNHWKDLLAVILDMWDDGDRPYESQTYVPGSLLNQMEEVRALLAIERITTTSNAGEAKQGDK